MIAFRLATVLTIAIGAIAPAKGSQNPVVWANEVTCTQLQALVSTHPIVLTVGAIVDTTIWQIPEQAGCEENGLMAVLAAVPTRDRGLCWTGGYTCKTPPVMGLPPHPSWWDERGYRPYLPEGWGFPR